LEHLRKRSPQIETSSHAKNNNAVPTGTNSDEEPGLTGGHETQGRCNQKQAEGISYGKTNQSTNKSKQEETCSTVRGNQVWAVVSSRDWNQEHSSPNRRVADKNISDNEVEIHTEEGLAEHISQHPNRRPSRSSKTDLAIQNQKGKNTQPTQAAKLEIFH
jgi:hypothetical protein